MRKLTFLFLLIPSFLFAHDSPRKANKKIGANPLIIIDSVKISHDDFLKVAPQTIASVTILTDTDATKAYGEGAIDGAIICETRIYAKERYVKFFRKISPQYDSLYTITNSDSTFQYIINKKVKTDNYEGDLAAINEDLFISLEILTADDLKNKYGITGKTYGILINSRKPANLYHKNRKF